MIDWILTLTLMNTVSLNFLNPFSFRKTHHSPLTILFILLKHFIIDPWFLKKKTSYYILKKMHDILPYLTKLMFLGCMHGHLSKLYAINKTKTDNKIWMHASK